MATPAQSKLPLDGRLVGRCPLNGTNSLRALDEKLEGRADCLIDAAVAVPACSLRERAELRTRALTFLRHDVGEHILLDEHVLYPRITARLGDPLATAPMNYEHGAIRWWMDEIAHADLADTETLQRLLYGVHALLKLHLSREEDLYVGALESDAWPATSGARTRESYVALSRESRSLRD